MEVVFTPDEGACLASLLEMMNPDIPKCFPKNPSYLEPGEFSFGVKNKYEKIPIRGFKCTYLVGPFEISLEICEDFWQPGVHEFLFTLTKNAVVYQERGHDLQECFEKFSAHLRQHEPQIPPFPLKKAVKMFRCGGDTMMLGNLRREQEQQHCKTKKVVMEGLQQYGKDEDFLARHQKLLK